MTALLPAGSTRRWRRLRRLVLERDGYRCQLPLVDGRLCRQPASHVDHVVPRVQGGADELGNLRASCAACNLRRGAGRPTPTPTPTRPSWSW